MCWHLKYRFSWLTECPLERTRCLTAPKSPAPAFLQPSPCEIHSCLETFAWLQRGWHWEESKQAVGNSWVITPSSLWFCSSFWSLPVLTNSEINLSLCKDCSAVLVSQAAGLSFVLLCNQQGGDYNTAAYCLWSRRPQFSGPAVKYFWRGSNLFVYMHIFVFLIAYYLEA